MIGIADVMMTKKTDEEYQLFSSQAEKFTIRWPQCMRSNGQAGGFAPSTFWLLNKADTLPATFNLSCLYADT
jgi:hypothetical protein